MLAKPNTAEILGAQTFLRTLGADYKNRYMIKAVIAWFRQESGGVSKVLYNNPFNIRPGVATKYSYGTWQGRVGSFLKFSSLSKGFAAAAMTLRAIAPAYGYGTVITAAKSGNATRFLAALALSGWDGTHYGVDMNHREEAFTTKNHLRDVYNQIPLPVL
jgi:hypothetical protein